MGTFRNDPPPFIGGKQPLEGRKMSPSLMGAAADSPPLRKASLLLAVVLASWVPPDPSPFMGGQQPLKARTLPVQVTAVPVNDPPFTQRRQPHWPNWTPPDPLPTLAGKLSPAIPGQSVDNPPSWRAQPLPTLIPDPPPTQANKLSPGISGQSVDIVLRVPSVPLSVLLSWQVADSLPTLTTKLVQVTQADTVGQPLRYPLSVWYAWQQPDPPPTLTVKLVQPFVASASVPKGDDALTVVVQTWQQPDPLPTLTRKLPPSITAVSVDNPSGVASPRIVTLDPILLPQAPKKIASVIASQVAAQTPYVRQIASIVASWQPVDLPPQQSRQLSPGIPGQSADPPPLRKPQSQSWAFTGDLSFITGPQGAPASVDTPPFGAFYSALNITPIWWIPLDPLPTLSIKLVQPGAAVVVNDPPFSSRRVPHWPNWTPPDPLPTLAGKLALPITAVAVNNPSGSLVPCIVVVPQPPLPQQSMKIAAVLPVPVDNPPFEHPGRSVTTALITYLTWQPPDPQPTLSGKLPSQVTAVPVNNPPFTHQGRLQRDLILSAWQPPPPAYVTIKMVVKIVQEGPLPPPATQIEFFPFIANVGTMMRRG